MVSSLDVLLWGEKVGTLVSTKQGYREQVCFYFDPSYASRGLDIAPLRAPLTGVAAQRGLPVYPEAEKDYGGLPSFIADSLPDKWGNMVFTEWAKENKIRMKDLSPLDRLAYIGRRGMGALEFLPSASESMETSVRVEIAELSRLSKMATDEARDFHAVMGKDFVIESLFRVGTSAGGRRPKAVINVNLLTGECCSGQVPTGEPGFTPMIIKFDEQTDVPTTRIEYSYYLMAKAVGMTMMPSMIIEEAHHIHFLTERFDRKGDHKIHVQTLAAMSPGANCYEDLFATAFSLGAEPSEIRQLFLNMVMNVVAGNVDDHNKNFSFMMDHDGRWHIAPAYDFTFTVDTSGPSYINRHCMTVNGRDHDICKSDILEIARRYNIKSAATIIDHAIATVGGYRRFAVQSGVPDAWIDRIEREITSRVHAMEGI